MPRWHAVLHTWTIPPSRLRVGEPVCQPDAKSPIAKALQSFQSDDGQDARMYVDKGPSA